MNRSRGPPAAVSPRRLVGLLPNPLPLSTVDAATMAQPNHTYMHTHIVTYIHACIHTYTMHYLNRPWAEDTAQSCYDQIVIWCAIGVTLAFTTHATG